MRDMSALCHKQTFVIFATIIGRAASLLSNLTADRRRAYPLVYATQ
jgi:hypothetical protein